MATAVPSAVAATAVSRGQRFFFHMSLVCLAVAMLGFAPTYWMPMARGALHVSPITRVHALFAYAWVLLFVLQASLASSGRITRHRELGVAGVAGVVGAVGAALRRTSSIGPAGRDRERDRERGLS